MPKASIVIPVYNKEKYLKETLVSVDKQTEDDIEVIIIDDASTDNGLDIITDFANNTKKQVRVFKNETNQGVAYSRNIGIQETKSEYITFLDADDTLNTNFMEVMLNKAEKHPFVDLIRGRIQIFSDSKLIEEGMLRGHSEEQIIVPSINPDYIYKEIVSCNGRLYNSDFIKNLKFVESSYEDYEFSLDTILSCRTILYTNQAIYNYQVINEGKNLTEVDKFLKTFLSYDEIYDRILEKHPNITDDMHKNLIKKQIRIYINYLKYISESNIKASDKISFIENSLVYLKHKYNMSEEDIIKIIGRPVYLNTTIEEAKQKIKEILIKY